VPSLLLRDKRDFAAKGALIIRGALDEAEAPQLVIQREMMRRIAWTGVQAAEAINPSGFLRARRKRPRRRAAEQHDESPSLAVRRRWAALARSGYLIRDPANPCQPTAYLCPKAEDGNRRKSVLRRARQRSG
jgi:hypothetical protein